jgi:hypothetical protein
VLVPKEQLNYIYAFFRWVITEVAQPSNSSVRIVHLYPNTKIKDTLLKTIQEQAKLLDEPYAYP